MKKFMASIAVVCFSLAMTANFAYADFVAGDLNVEVIKTKLKGETKVNKIILKELGVKSNQVESVSEEQLIEAMNKILRDYNFYRIVDKNKLTLSSETKKMLKKIRSLDFYRVRPKSEDIANLNLALLKAIYPKSFVKAESINPGTQTITDINDVNKTNLSQIDPTGNNTNYWQVKSKEKLFWGWILTIGGVAASVYGLQSVSVKETTDVSESVAFGNSQNVRYEYDRYGNVSKITVTG